MITNPQCPRLSKLPLEAFCEFQGDEWSVWIVFVLNVSENLRTGVRPKSHACLPLAADRSTVFRPAQTNIGKRRRQLQRGCMVVGVMDAKSYLMLAQ